jgi:hypothetical protein
LKSISKGFFYRLIIITYDEFTMEQSNIIDYNDNFYTFEYILSKKYKKYVGLFGYEYYENYVDYDIFDCLWILEDIVFDLRYNDDPVKLLRSMLLHMSREYFSMFQQLIQSTIDHNFPVLSKLDSEQTQTGLIYLLGKKIDWSNDSAIYDVTTIFLADLLGANRLIRPGSDGSAASVDSEYNRSYVFDNSINFSCDKDIGTLLATYHENCKRFIQLCEKNKGTYNKHLKTNEENIVNIESNNDDKLICNICMVNLKNCSLDPCGHCYCMECVKKINKCSICRMTFIRVSKIYI